MNEFNFSSKNFEIYWHLTMCGEDYRTTLNRAFFSGVDINFKIEFQVSWPIVYNSYKNRAQVFRKNFS